MTAPRQSEDETGVAGSDGDVSLPAKIETTIGELPDEILLLIFKHLEKQDIVFSIAKVCIRWEKVASDPALWSDQFVFYNSIKHRAFTETMHVAKKRIKYLHLGGHEAMEAVAAKALLSSNVTVIKRLSFLGSCRTNPTNVIRILNKFRSNLECLTLCINDELVSYGTDEKTCYAFKDAHARPGILFNLIGRMEKLRHLTLCGGYSSKWYFGELLQSPGCNKIETLDLKDFEELSENFRPNEKLDLVESLLLKNQDCLRSLKLSIMVASNPVVRQCVREYHKSLESLSINIKQLNGFPSGSLNLNFLELSGRFVYDRRLEPVTYIITNESHGDLLHKLNEFNFIQFNIVEEENMFYDLAKYLHNIKILRIEGDWLTSENIAVMTGNLPFLERICVRGTHTVAEKHLVSMRFPLSILKDIDLDNILDMDCIYVATKFKTIPLLDYFVIETGCECRMNFHGESEFKSDLVSEASSPKLCTLKMMHLTLSKNLDVKFLPRFWEFCENDRIFHLEQ